MARPYRWDRSEEINDRYDAGTEEAYRMERMEKQLQGAIETAEQMEPRYSKFEGVPELLRGVLSDVADERAQLEESLNDMWDELRLRGEAE